MTSPAIFRPRKLMSPLALLPCPAGTKPLDWAFWQLGAAMKHCRVMADKDAARDLLRGDPRIGERPRAARIASRYRDRFEERAAVIDEYEAEDELAHLETA